MHYYQFNIADYRKDTTHLNPLEHYIYRQLIDWYFLDEKPINKNLNVVLRRLNLDQLDHTHLLENVLLDFFVENDDGFHHKRIDIEIKGYQSYLNKQSENGKKGGRPHKIKTQKNPPLNLDNPNLTQKKPNQEPLTTNQELLTKDQETIRENSDEISTQKKPVVKIPFKKIIELYHEMLPTLPRIEKLTKTREGFIRQRWIEDLPDINHWENYFDYIKQSDFLMGRVEPLNGKRVFRADLEWIIRPSNFAKISEDKYHGE